MSGENAERAGTVNVRVKLFAQLRQAAGTGELERTVDAGTTAGALARAVLAELELGTLADRIVVAGDREYLDPGTVLSDGAVVSLVPPVSGGAPSADAAEPPGPVVDVRITAGPLEPQACLDALAARAVGATVLFQGTPRDVDALAFEAAPELARAELGRIAAELCTRHALTGMALHHRTGEVPSPEAVILVAAAAPRRVAAFTAAADALEEIKRRVPVWKSEVDGPARRPVEGETVSAVPTVGEAPGEGGSGVSAGAPPAPQPDAGPGGLTHLAADGSARMVDVTDKAVTDRLARAVATVRMRPATARLVRDGSGPKGEVLATARLAGTMAAKRTAELVPLAHPLPLTKLGVEATVDVDGGAVHLEATARTTGKTGVEIEALTAVLIAALTVYDMVKAVERHASIEGVRVVEKQGGRHDFRVEAEPAGGDASPSTAGVPVASGGGAPGHAPAHRPLRVAAVHVSTSRARGDAQDRSRGALAAFAGRTGWTVAADVMVPDDRSAIADAIREGASTPGVEAVLTLGGTGLTPDDVTPDVTREVVDREVPGLGEALRATSMQITPLASLSRATAGVLGSVVVVNLPGSPKALAELEPLLTVVLPHACSQAARPV